MSKYKIELSRNEFGGLKIIIAYGTSMALPTGHINL